MGCTIVTFQELKLSKMLDLLEGVVLPKIVSSTITYTSICGIQNIVCSLDIQNVDLFCCFVCRRSLTKWGRVEMNYDRVKLQKNLFHLLHVPL